MKLRLLAKPPLRLGWILASAIIIGVGPWEPQIAWADPTAPIERGWQLYELGQYSEAIAWLNQKLKFHQRNQDVLGEATTLSNLALVYGELGQWQTANQAIETSQSILRSASGTHATSHLLAQVLNTQGQLQLQQGNAETALDIWTQAETLFQSINHREGIVRSQLNQAQALQSLGFYRRSLVVLTDLTTEISHGPESLDKAIRFRSLGIALQASGDMIKAEEALQKSLRIAQDLEHGDAIAQSLIALGNLDARQNQHIAALAHYQQASTPTAQSSTQLNARLNELQSYLELQRWDKAHALWPPLLRTIEASSPTSNTVQAQLNLAHSLQRLRAQAPLSSLPSIVVAQLLSEAQRQARILGDRRLESYALGKLGALYEQGQQYSDAQQVTQQALDLVDLQASGEVAYQWQWQLGRIAKQQGENSKAIAYYGSAANLLRQLRQESVSSNPDIQFEFQERVEPLYREYVALLLGQPNPSNDALEKVRQAMESLQLAELDNFFRAACLDTTPVIVDQIDPSAVVIYPIVLPDQLAIIVRLPGKPLKLYLTQASQSQVERVTERLRNALEQPNSRRYRQLSQKLYDWLLRPAIADIQASEADTLVFIPDGGLRSIPLGVLHNGDRFVIEDYAVSVTPGLQLIQAGAEEQERSRVLISGLTQAQGGFGALKYVATEVDAVTDRLRHHVLLDADFTQQKIERAIKGRSFPILHLATHGQFSSDLEGTFLQAWGERLDIDRLREILQDSELTHRRSLELLVLSACDTAEGDRRAVLGLAGIAARSGAKSTLASLWKVNDRATAALMEEFYNALDNRNLHKAEALQQAQKAFLNNPKYDQHPYYWSAFILVGSWK